MVSFQTDILPLFRPFDISSMTGIIDLTNYDDVKANAADILTRLNDTTNPMPCDGRWPQAWIDLFQAWIDAGLPHFDAAPHSSFVISNRDTFSTAEIGISLSYPNAFFVVYDGFTPEEVGTPTGTRPAIAFTDAQTGTPLSSISAQNPSLGLEDPSGAPDAPQRVTIAYDIHFTGSSEFPAQTGGMRPIRMRVSLTYTGNAGTATELTAANLLLVNQPNPYMIDVEGGNPAWLSVDTRVFQVPTGGVRSGHTQGDANTDPDAPHTFIQGLVGTYNALPDNGAHPFRALPSSEEASPLELSRSVGGVRMFNYGVAKVRYVAPAGVDASDVRVFFRMFSTMVSALDYDHTGGPTGNYRRAGSIPLLGIQGNEIASIPFFASARVDTSASPMSAQTDPSNVRTIVGAGSEQVAYFGCWLDINLAAGDPHGLQFPSNPSSDPGGPDGPYSGTRQTIQTLVRGIHQCLVAEVFFQPAGTDPIPTGATPGSSDRLAQRNLALVQSGNPGWPDSHTIQHTFMVKPSSARRVPGVAALPAAKQVAGPDELLVRWDNMPRDSDATFFFPELEADEVLSLAAQRAHPPVLEKVDANTLRCHLADVAYIPLPDRPGFLAGLLSVTLPDGIVAGHTYRMSLGQYSGLTHKMLGTFQVTIPVRRDADVLPIETRRLSVLRYIHASIPAGNRWDVIFARYLDGIARQVRAFGGDPDAVKPSPDGGEGPEPPGRHATIPVRPSDMWCLPIPWDTCDLEGEVTVRIRFRNC